MQTGTSLFSIEKDSAPIAFTNRLPTMRHLITTITVLCLSVGCGKREALKVDIEQVTPPQLPAEFALPEPGEALNTAIAQGRVHFDTYACWRCHALGDEALPGSPDIENSGPDLQFVGDRLSVEALYQSLTNPNLVIAPPKADHINEEGFSKMPPFDTTIPKAELRELIVFLATQKPPKTSPVTVTAANFTAEVTQSEGLILLDFWAEWCLPCLEIEPLLETIAADLGEQIKICKINVDDNPNLVAEYVPDNMFPCLVLMTNNTLIDRVYGTDPDLAPKVFLDQWIGKHLSP